MFAMRMCRIMVAVMFTAMLAGCYFGRSTIRASDGGTYDVYADGRYICSTDEECSVTTRGAWGKVLFEAQKGSHVVGHDIVSREITAASVLWMPFTYFLSLFVYQAYPDEIVIPIDSSAIPVQQPTWQSESSENSSVGGSVWEKPIY